jgi:hypothetical protein
MASPFSLGQNMGWQGNPLYDALSSRRNALVGLGAGLASGNDWGEGIGRGLELAGQGAVRDDAYALMQEEQAKEAEVLNKTTEWLRQNGQTQWLAAVESGAVDPGTAFNAVLTAQSSPERGVVINGQLVDPASGAILGDYRDQAAGSTEYGLTPIWGQFPDGTFGYGVQGKDGTFRQVDTGELNPLDPRTLAGERAYGTAIGASQGQGVAAAPSDIANATTALNILDQIETSPELPWATGTSAGLGGNRVPGTGRYGFQNLVDQAKSGAFLSAIQDMRGLGALSNAEGQVATAAITRMDTALSEADFRKALADYRTIINRGLERAQGRVGMQPNVNAPRPQPNTGTTSSGLTWSVSQ